MSAPVFTPRATGRHTHHCTKCGLARICTKRGCFLSVTASARRERPVVLDLCARCSSAEEPCST